MNRIKSLLFCLAIAAIASFLPSCSGKQGDVVPSTEFAPYINAYTGGVLSQSSVIRIELAQDQPVVDLNNELKGNPFRFSPSIKGKTFWIDNHTLEFLPEEGELKPGKFYRATFRLGDFVSVDKRLKDFEFSFRVQANNYSMTVDPLDIAAATPDQVSIKGELNFSIDRTLEQVQQMLTVEGEAKPAILVKSTDNPSRFVFSINPVPRKDKEYSLTVKANGKAAGVDKESRQEITIPAKGEFRFLSAGRIEVPENGVQLVFSDPVSETQDLKGLVEAPELKNYICQVSGNKVNLYFEPGKTEKLTIKIHEGLRNWNDQALGTSESVAFSELNLKPQVEMKNAGAILPDSKNLVMPFRAVNLYAVDLSIIRVYERNILSFLQSNSLESNSEIRRFGRLIYKKTLPLNSDASKDIHKWEDYSIDLSGIIKQEPGAIYRILLSFKQEYSAYPCGTNKEVRFSSDRLTKVATDGLSEQDEQVWDVPEAWISDYDGFDWSKYKWNERDNPCQASYYMLPERQASCNVFSSNLGIIVKQNSARKLWVAVNNILDTSPVKDATLTVYNFQLTPIATAKTDADGLAEIEPKGGAFVVMAESGKHKAYLKIRDGEEQSVSRFDVGGKEIRNGLKGYIYGERGVWRPGDTLFVSFMLEDREAKIPEKHPVSIELYNPQGQFYAKRISTEGVKGLYVFRIPTQANDPTGLWNAYVKIGGATFHKSLRIEAIKPNRLKINLDIPGEKIKASEREVQARLSSSWLTGAKASKLKAKVELTLSKSNTQFKGYEKYIFNNPATEFTSARKEVFSGTLNEEGYVSFAMKLPESALAPGMLRADITTRVFEPGGDASINTKLVPFSPFNTYVGINLHQPKDKYLETDKDHTFDVVTLTADGKSVGRQGLEYKIYRLDWSWWWDTTYESFGNYVNNNSVTPVASGKLNTVDGKGKITFRINYPAWGRYLVYVKDKEGGHATGGTVFIDWPEWRGRSSKNDPEGIKMLTFALDKESYQPGETVSAIVPAAAGGRALVAIENGSTVLKREWIEISGTGDTKYQFKVTADMAPNVYLHISLLQPHAQTTNDLPIRLYGVMPVFVTDKQTVLEPQIRMPDALRPEKEFSISINEKNGKPMTYTLAIVDDGLLDLSNFKTPDPWSEFYSREALGIRTWDLYDNVMGAFAGTYGSMFSTGGDEALKQLDNKANRFRPVVKFIGPFCLPKGGSRTHKINLPMYVGSVRTMVVAGQDGAYGKAEKTTPVRTPLMLLSTLPRVISTGEEIRLPVNVFALEGNVKDVDVSVSTSGGLSVAGITQQSLHFDKAGDQLISFQLKAGAKTGKAVVKLTAEGSGQTAMETVEIEVRNPNPVLTLRANKWIEAGASGELTYEMEAASPENNLRVEMSRIPSVDISRRLDFLYNYSHSCTEQIVSKVLPLLFVDQLRAVDEEEASRIKTNLEAGIKQLYGRQLPNGGFAYWPGNAVADEWITSYTGMFLTMAREKGFSVNSGVLNKWTRFQASAAQNWRTPDAADTWLSWQSDLQQAFRLYTLALAGAPEQGAMNRMKETQDRLSLQARWRLAAAFALNGKSKPADELVFNIPAQVESYSSNNRVYGSSLRDEAMILETLVLMGRDREALDQAKVVSRDLTDETWFSTQSTAFGLMAMGRLAGKMSGSLDFEWSVNGKVQPAVKSAKALFESIVASPGLKGSVVVKNKAEGALSFDLITRTQLVDTRQIASLPAMANNLRIDVKYTDMNDAPMEITNLKQGTDFLAVVTVSNISPSSDFNNLALTHIIPSGWEIYPVETPLIASPRDSSGFTYRDIRDDRVLTYFDLPRGKAKTFTTRLQATYAGRFILPALQCEAMYDAAAQTRTKAGEVRVN